MSAEADQEGAGTAPPPSPLAGLARHLLAGVLLAALGCASTSTLALAPIPPERAHGEVAAARLELATSPRDPSAVLRLGAALYHAGDYEASLETLSELMEEGGTIGRRAALYHAAASERQEDWSAARRGYSRYLAGARSREVEARLREVRRLEAEAAVREAIAHEQRIDPASLPEWSVAMTPLRVAAADSSLEPLGYGLADLIATDLARIGRLQLVERIQLNALLRELEFGESDRVAAATAPRIGKLLGARRVVSGTITALPRERLSIDASISDVSASAVTSTSPAATTLSDIFEAQKELTFRIVDALGLTLTPAERVAIEQRHTKSLAALLAYSRGVRDEVHGRWEQASAEYGRAALIDSRFELARIRLQDMGAGRAGIGRPPHALVNRVNPSPAARLSAVRAQSEEIGSVLESAESAIVVIPIVIIPVP